MRLSTYHLALCFTAMLNLSFLAGCNAQPQAKTEAEIMAEFRRTLAQTTLIREQRICLEKEQGHKLTVAQLKVLEGKSEYQMQRFFSAQISVECEVRALNFCESHYPGDCLAIPGDTN